MKILYVASRYDGGMGGHATQLGKKLAEHGFDIEFMQVPHIAIKGLKNPSFTVFGALKAMINKKEYDIVHGWNIPSAFVIKHINAKKKTLSVAGIYTEQMSLIHSSLAGKLAKYAERKAMQEIDACTTDSKDVQQYYNKTFDISCTYLPAPINTAEFIDIPKPDKRKDQVVYVGRDSYEKGIDILKSIESKINANVVYCTSVSWKKAMQEIACSKALVVPSRMESMPTVIKEAFYLKTPVVATQVGGVPEIVKDKTTGLLVDPENPDLLLEKINYVLSENVIAQKLADAAFDYIVENFTYDVVLDKYIKFYKSLLE